MGKKRQFKRSDDKKATGSSSNPVYKQPPPGIVGPETTYIDNRVDPNNYVPPSPPVRLTDAEILAEGNARKAAAGNDMSSEQIAQQEQVFSRKQKVSQSDPANHTLSVDNFAEERNDNAAQQPQPAGEFSEPVTFTRKKKRVAEIIEELKNDVEMESTRRHLLLGAWKARDKVYNQLFGKPTYVIPENYGPPLVEVPEGFATRDHAKPETWTPDPIDEQPLAVLAYAPDPQAPYWKYVTAGLASPWVQYEPLQVSGFGCELMIKSPTDALWAPELLRTLAYYIFNMAGTLSQGVRLALNSSIDPGFESKLRNAFIWYADEAPDTLYELPSGLFSVLMVIGMSDDERAFADSIEEYGTWSLQALLRQAGHEQVTDPKRPCAMEHDNINAIKMSVRNFAETFRANRAGLFTADPNEL
ncbi:MAG: suppressor of fused domain protein [Candidatus Melainabacteria bacterium]|nr:suppressor of fused domain protein [Candidatus Melainabacteria bacterium]